MLGEVLSSSKVPVRGLKTLQSIMVRKILKRVQKSVANISKMLKLDNGYSFCGFLSLT